MADFTVTKYIQLLNALIGQDYHFQTFHEFMTDPAPPCIILRHDVDKRPGNSLTLAKIEAGLGVKGVYNHQRPHLSCGILTPEDARKLNGNLKNRWRNY
jgi:hypothetical protein